MEEKIFLKETTKAIVKQILTENTIARDDDMELYIAFIKNRIKEYNEYSAEQLLDMIQFTIPKFETISRVRRLLQNQHHELRGVLYKFRKEKLTKKIKDELKNE